MIEIKLRRWEKAIAQVEGINGEKAAYIRSFAHAKQGRWQEVQQEWHSLPDSQKKSEFWRFLEREKLERIAKIQQLVDEGDLAQAKFVSEEFFPIFGTDKLVQRNLEGHIYPLLAQASWQGDDWQKIAKTAEDSWLQHQDIQCLHNWAVALYYLFQIEPSKLDDLIIAWSGALANIHQDPSLEKISWLGDENVNFTDVFSQLKERLERLIDGLKHDNLEEYWRLSDRFRLEFLAIESMGNPPKTGVKLNNLCLTPGCYESLKGNLSENSSSLEKKYTDLEQESLYTAWGMAVAACNNNDVTRAVKIKPHRKPKTEAETYGHQLVCYYEGCDCLEKKDWHKAKNPLNEAKSLINKSSERSEKIDILCEKQRGEINDLHNHLEFAKFWYNLRGSKPSRLYLGEYKAIEVIERVGNQNINFSSALDQLRQIKRDYGDNAVVNDCIDRVELAYDHQRVQDKIKNSDFQEAVNIAKNSRHQEVKTTLVELFLTAFNNLSKNPNPSREELFILCQTVLYIYEIDKSFIDYSTYREYEQLYNNLKYLPYKDYRY